MELKLALFSAFHFHFRTGCIGFTCHQLRIYRDIPADCTEKLSQLLPPKLFAVAAIFVSSMNKNCDLFFLCFAKTKRSSQIPIRQSSNYQIAQQTNFTFKSPRTTNLPLTSRACTQHSILLSYEEGKLQVASSDSILEFYIAHSEALI